MPADFISLLECAVAGAALGLGIALVMRCRYPDQGAKWAPSQDYAWWAWGLFAILFAGLTSLSALQEQYSFAAFFLAFMILQIGAMFTKLLHPNATPGPGSVDAPASETKS